MRDARLSKSNQLLFSELKLKLEAVSDKNKPIVFDFGMKPDGVSSWRGSYCELAIEYSLTGGGRTSWNTEEVESDYGGYKSYKQASFELPQEPTTQQFLALLDACMGKDMVGYKGGNFTMHKNVAVYVANYGECSILDYRDKECATVAPFDIVEEPDKVVILTDEYEY